MVWAPDRRRLLKASATGFLTISGISTTKGRTEPPGQFSGQVSNPWGDPLTNAEVAVFDYSATANEPLASTTTNENGRFAFEPFDQAENQFLMVQDTESGFFLINSSVTSLPTDAEVDLTAPHQLMFGPEIASYSTGGNMLYVTVWRQFVFTGEENYTDQFLRIELTGLKDEQNAVHRIDTVLNPSFSLTLPENGVRVDYNGQEGVDNSGITIYLVTDDPPSERAEWLYDWHPSQTGAPGILSASDAYRPLSEPIANEEKEEAEIIPGVAEAIPGLGELIALADESGIIGTKPTSELVLGENIDPPNRNEVDTVTSGLPFGASSAVFSVPLRFTEQEEQTMFAEASWGANPFNLDVDRLHFQTEFSMGPGTGSDSTSESNTQSGSTWPMYQYDSGNTGSNPVAQGLQTDQVQERWSNETDQVFSSPAVYDGTVYYGSIQGQANGAIYAADTATGEIKWSIDRDEPVRTSPVIANDRIYYALDGSVYALDPDTGETEWTIETSGNGDSNPILDDGMLYVNFWEGRGADNVTISIYAIDLAEQEIQWSENILGNADSPLVKAGDNLYIQLWHPPSSSTRVDKLSIERQSSIARYDLQVSQGIKAHPGQPTLITSGGKLLIPLENDVACFDVDTNSEQWKYETESRMGEIGAVIDDTFCIADRDRRVHAIDTETGEAEWTYQAERGGYNTGGGIHVSAAQNTVYVTGDIQETVYALDLSDGSKRWGTRLESPAGTPATVTSDAVFVGGFSNGFYALESAE